MKRSRGASLVEVLLWGSIALMILGMLIQAIFIYQGKRAELGFDSDASVSATRLFERLKTLSHKSVRQGVTVRPDLLSIQPILGVTTFSKEKWSANVFLAHHNSEERKLYWTEQPLLLLALTHDPKKPQEFTDSIVPPVIQKLGGEVQRNLVEQVDAFNYTFSTESVLEVNLTLRNEPRTGAKPFTRSRRFYISFDELRQ